MYVVSVSAPQRSVAETKADLTMPLAARSTEASDRARF